jgi:hypothetical protein
MTALREVFKTGKGFDGWLTYLYNLCLGDPKGSPIFYPVIISINLPDHQNVTTFLGFQHQVFISIRFLVIGLFVLEQK